MHNSFVFLIIYVILGVWNVSMGVEFAANELQVEENLDNNLELAISSRQDYLNCKFVVKNGQFKQQLRVKSILRGKTYREELDPIFQFSSGNNYSIEISQCERIRPRFFITPTTITAKKIDSMVNRALNYMQDKQVKQTVGQSRYKGEWGSTMMARKGFAILLTKKGTAAWDSNCFTTSTIVNSLADIYPSVTVKQQQKIRTMLQLALTDVLACQEGGSFNFWHTIDMPKKFQRLGKVNRVKSPNNFPYKKRLFYFFSNVVNDADDTAIAYLALDNIEKILGVNKKPLEKIGQLFSPFRDLRSRHTINLYDAVTFRPRHTGAFMTWLSHDEYPFLWLPSMRHQSIPMRTNDVDCVVNSNVLTTLARYNELETTTGVAGSCHYLKQQIHRKNFSKCALYYPNRYMFPYAMSKAIREGAQCLQSERKHLQELILSLQQTDGSWDSFKEFDDLIQSTVLSLNALLNIYSGSEQERLAIARGITFLLQEFKQEGTKLWWSGGIYFSGGTFARKRVVWKSNAYTTSLVIEVLTKYRELFL